jgi:molecular chaperone GrpE (heat shock protein)
MPDVNYTEQLQELMQNAKIGSFNALCQLADVSRRQLLKLRRGEVKHVRIETLIKLSQALNISLDALINQLSTSEVENSSSDITESTVETLNSAVAEQELLKLVEGLNAEGKDSQLQKQLLLEGFQQSCLEILESLLLQLPTAAHKARENPQLPAVNILPLVEKPLERLLQAWGIEAIAQVGEEVSYNPQLHQPMEGNISPNQIVKVRYIGYHQQGKLLYRAKVSPILSQ